MKLFIGGLATETNTFSPMPTGRLAFEDTFVTREATRLTANFISAPLHVWRKMAEERGWEVVEGLMAFAQPSGTTTRDTYEAYRDEILEHIESSKPDIVLFSLHGAMIADGYDDCEGDLIARTRAILGQAAVIGVELDPHNHLTQEMMDGANLIISYKEYPHTDTAERAVELFDLAVGTKEGRIVPVMRDYDCRMIAMYHTTRAPMREFVDDMKAREGKDGILSLSLTHGFPWGDCPRVGTRMLAIADGSADKATRVALEFGERLWSFRDQLAVGWPSIEGALDRADAIKRKPVVLADFADNAGAGAPADSTFVLQEVRRRGLKDVALGIYWDPGVVRMALDAGIGATLQIRLGGKIGVMSGDPLDINVKVRGLRENMVQMLGDSQIAMGNGAWLEADGVHMILSDKRTQAFHPMAFTDLGLDLSQMNVVVVKSSQHFYVGFAPIASEVIYISGPGAVTPDYSAIPYTKRDGKYWPKVSNPF